MKGIKTGTMESWWTFWGTQRKFEKDFSPINKYWKWVACFCWVYARCKHARGDFWTAFLDNWTTSIWQGLSVHRYTVASWEPLLNHTSKRLEVIFLPVVIVSGARVPPHWPQETDLISLLCSFGPTAKWAELSNIRHSDGSWNGDQWVKIYHISKVNTHYISYIFN